MGTKTICKRTDAKVAVVYSCYRDVYIFTLWYYLKNWYYVPMMNLPLRDLNFGTALAW